MATLQSLLSQRDAIDRKRAEQKSKRTMNEETIKLLDVKIKNLEAHKKAELHITSHSERKCISRDRIWRALWI